VTDVRYLFACPRFPGSVFDWEIRTITQHKEGIENLDPFAALHMDKLAYFIPLRPTSEGGYVFCRSKRLTVPDIVEAMEDQCEGNVQRLDISRPESSAYWIFPTELGAKFHVFAGRNKRLGNIYIKYQTSPKTLAKVEGVMNDLEQNLRIKFKPASHNKIAV